MTQIKNTQEQSRKYEFVALHNNPLFEAISVQIKSTLRNPKVVSL
jgi:hypothetical protein